LAALVVFLLGVVLAPVIWRLPQEPGGLTAEAAARLEASGVAHPVTAVLLNYRGYDTWLEVGVLLLAVLAVLILRREHDLSGVPVATSDDPLLGWVVRWLLPVMLLTGGYLLWLGTSGPGGAFQAGAVLAAAAVLLLLAGHRSITALPGGWLRLALTLGFAAFLLLALALLLGGRRLLEYPSGAAGALILLVETAVTLSIAATLAALFGGARPSVTPAGKERGA
jgi:multisubunit Na+/H+ antiporter MnhB subunit